MKTRLIFRMENNRYKVPENEALYLKNLDYYKGMGLYDEALCQEKALLTTGYIIVPGNGQDT